MSAISPRPDGALLEMEDPRALRLEADVPEGLLDKIHMGDKTARSRRFHDQSIRRNCERDLPCGRSQQPDVPRQAGPPCAPRATLWPVRARRHPRRDGGIAICAFERCGSARASWILFLSFKPIKPSCGLLKTGKRSNNEVEVLSGLETGETLAVEGAASLVNGPACGGKAVNTDPSEKRSLGIGRADRGRHLSIRS